MRGGCGRSLVFGSRLRPGHGRPSKEEATDDREVCGPTEDLEPRRIRVIAEETGLSQGAILRVKHVKMERVSLSTLETLCRYFGTNSLCDLIEYVPDEGQQKEPK